MKAKLLVAVLALGACLAVCRADEVVGSFHRSYNVGGRVELEVETGAGAIHVTGAPGSMVTVDGTIHQSASFWGEPDPEQVRQQVKAIEANPPIDQSGSRVSIHSVRQGWGERVWMSYVITTPANTDLVAHAGSGAIEVGGIGGNADLSAGSGRLRIAELGGNLRAGTGSGSIAFDRIGGTARISAGSGSIEGNEVVGRLEATTASGHIRVRQLDAGGEIQTSSGGMDLDQVTGDLTAHASSGSITVGGVLAAQHRWDLSSSSGSIHLSLPEQTTAQVRLWTSSGGLSVNHPTSSQTTLGRHTWEGVIGRGTPTGWLTASTSSGSIHLN